MSKKVAIIISIVGTILIAVAVVAILQLTNKPQADPKEDVRQPGDSVTIADTPSLKACETVPLLEIKRALGDAGNSLSSGEREGVVAHNLENAESCIYTFQTNESVKSQLTVQAYPYLPNDASETSNTFDSSWRNITAFEHPAYTLVHPAYFKKIAEEGDMKFVLQIVTGPRHYRFEISQPEAQATFTEDAATKLLINLALKADYTAADDESAPPAPSSAKPAQTPTRSDNALTPPPAPEGFPTP